MGERGSDVTIDMEIEFEKHQPILSMRDGSIAGCQCMDRIFYREHESWGAHLLAVADALLGPDRPMSDKSPLWCCER